MAVENLIVQKDLTVKFDFFLLIGLALVAAESNTRHEVIINVLVLVNLFTVIFGAGCVGVNLKLLFVHLALLGGPLVDSITQVPLLVKNTLTVIFDLRIELQ